MRKVLFLVIVMIITKCVNSQNKMGNIWVTGNRLLLTAEFNGIARPTIQIRNDSLGGGFPYYFASSGSNICDSASGKLLFMSNAMRIWDSSGNIMLNGDSLQPLKIYTQNTPPLQGQTQGSLILPKGINGQFYVFISTVSDSLYDLYWTPQIKTPFDQLRYNIIDMQTNGGKGSVIEKNKLLLKNTEMVRTEMQACRHANGRDWWLIKQISYGENILAKFLVTKDSIYGPYIQQFAEPNWGQFDATGQICFSSDGKKFASLMGKSNQLFIADFDRCSGEFSNPQVKYIPIDSSTIPNPLPQYIMDSAVNGVCFSPNGNYIYITRRYNIYQYEYGLSDSSLAWVRVQHGPDTTYNKFQYYGHLYRGPDDRMYIGNWGGTAKQFSVLDYPNSKGLACGFCRKCFRLDTSAFFAVSAPPNMPDYTLGADMSKVCWPLSSQQYEVGSEHVVVWPNPTSGKLYIKYEIASQSLANTKKELYNSIGQMVLSTKENEIDVSHLANGVYYLKCGIYTRKVVVE